MAKMENLSSLAASNLSCKEGDLGVLRRIFPRLLGSLSEASLVSLRPHLVRELVERAGGEVLFEEGTPSVAFTSWSAVGCRRV